MNKELIGDSKRYSLPLGMPSMGVYFVALISSIVLVGTQPPIEIKRPWILLLVFLAGLIPAKEGSFSVLQKLLVAYFLCMLVSELALEKMVLGGQGFRLILPKCLIPLFFYAIAFILTISTEKFHELLKRNQLWYWLWGAVIIIQVIHMGFLWAALGSIYGYGYAHNISVLGNIVLYMMCFLFTWDILERPLVRGLSSGCVITYLLLLILL